MKLSINTTHDAKTPTDSMDVQKLNLSNIKQRQNKTNSLGEYHETQDAAVCSSWQLFKNNDPFYF